jgi:tropomodulin
VSLCNSCSFFIYFIIIKNSYLPASDRCKSQTAKAPTGSYDRNKLLGFLTEQGQNEKDWDDQKPFVPGEKKGKVWEPPPIVKPAADEDDEFLAPTEWDDVLTNANESEIIELAGLFYSKVAYLFFILNFYFLAILGFTGLINQVQYHAAVTDKGAPVNSGGWNGMINMNKIIFKILFFSLAAAKGEALKIVPPEPDNTTNIEDCIKKAKANEKELTRINLNNIRDVKAEVLKELIDALKENKHVEILEMVNVGMTDSIGRVRLFVYDKTKF